MRTFLAVDISDEVRQSISILIDGFKGLESGIKWVDPKNIHITVYFFGEADESTVKALEAIIEESIKGMSSFRLHAEGISAFPSLRSPRVIWVGINNKSGELRTLFSRVGDGIVKGNLQVNMENREYTPHLTLGRVKRRPDKRLIEEIEKHGSEPFGSFSAGRIVLYRSTLTRNGPVYEPLREFSI
jgi:2'-5' RNA ligase